jgi:hypothetical protein
VALLEIKRKLKDKLLLSLAAAQDITQHLLELWGPD